MASTARFVARYALGVGEVDRTNQLGADDHPVLLVHGYGHNQSGWWEFDRCLRRSGQTSVHCMNYLPLGSGVPLLAQRLATRVDEIRERTGAQRVHVVAHSLGGILLRWYVQELGGDATVGTAITLACPHQGTLAAYLWPERTARHLRPGSWVIERLAAGARPSAVRWVAFWSDTDLLVRPHAAGRLVAPGLDATNVELHGIGHLSFLTSPDVMSAVAAELRPLER